MPMPVHSVLILSALSILFVVVVLQATHHEDEYISVRWEGLKTISDDGRAYSFAEVWSTQCKHTPDFA